MAELILTNYQATVFRNVETLLKTRGTPNGVPVNPKSYWLSKRIAVYIINNIPKTTSVPAGSSQSNVDVETVYNWIFQMEPPLPTPGTATTKVSNTGTPSLPIVNVMSLGKAWASQTDAQSDNISYGSVYSTVSNGPLVVSYDSTLAVADVLTKTNTPGPPIVSANNPGASIGSSIVFPSGTPFITKIGSTFSTNVLRNQNVYTYYFKVTNSSEPNYVEAIIEVENTITNFQIVPGVFTGIQYFGGDSELTVKNIIP